jgi:membrane protease YdiL (CAAX protease family)
VQGWPPAVIVAMAWSLLPLFAFGFAGDQITRALHRLPIIAQLMLPSVFGIPYWLVARSTSSFRASWLALYLTLPVVVAVLLWHAKQDDSQRRGNWQDLTVLLVLGLAVDLRWFEPAWPTHLSVVGKLILLDSGLYGFLVVRQLTNVGFDLRVRAEDLRIGLREFVFYAPIAVPLGLALGFLHWHPYLPGLIRAASTWIFTFALIAIPEEIYFRGWIQNLAERRLGRRNSLWLTAVIFGLSHFNKRSAHFNWRYVLLATLAGIFYGRAWRQRRRVAASAITHACVDAVWSLWLS